MYQLAQKSTKTGGQLLVESLLAHKIDMAFCVAGESYIAALDALYEKREQLKLISCRHESGATFMAEAYGKLTGKPGVCFVTRGPGACNASIAIHTAFQDQTPLILFIGQVARDVKGREGFQEVDFVQMFSPLAKWAVEIDAAARIPEIMHRAFHVATNGRRGPVVISLPEDMLTEMAEGADIPLAKQTVLAPTAPQIEQLQKLLESAKKPMVILGGGGWTQAASSDMRQFAEANNLPVACAFRRQDLIDNQSSAYVGDLGYGADPILIKRLQDSDLILAVGDRIGEVTSREYTAFTIPKMQQKLIHVFPDANELGRVYQPDLGICADVPEFAQAVKSLQIKSASQFWAESARQDYLKTLEPSPVVGGMDMAKVVKYLNEILPKDSIITNDAGNFSGWVHRYYQWSKFATQLAPCNGAMGYGVPSAVAASLLYPGRTVVGFAGDGGCLMTANEIATAIRYNARPILIVVNNNMYGTIRMHQEKLYPGHTHGTELTNPDFAAMMRAFGGYGLTVKKTEEFAPAFEEARKSGKAALIEIQLDPNISTTRTTLSALREAALGKKNV